MSYETMATSNSGSRSRTTSLTATSRSTCASTESPFGRPTSELNSTAACWGSTRTPLRSFLSSFRSWSSSVCSLTLASLLWWKITSFFGYRPKDPDVEDAPVVPEMGMIELRAFRTRPVRTVEYQPDAQYGLHRGRVSERSKKAGWHHVR